MKEKQKVLIVLIVVVIILTIASIFLFRGEKRKISDFTVAEQTEQIAKIEAAKEYGDDVIGWIRVEGTNIDMALIQRNDVADVSRMDYDFAWTNSFPDENSNHLNFISHNVRNVSSNPIIGDDTMFRFEQLMSFIYPDFINENQFIEITNEEGEASLYRIYGVALVNESQSASYYDTYTLEEQKEYIEKVRNESMYDIDVDVNENDMLLTLFTCTRFYGATTEYSFRVDARKLRENEEKYLIEATTNDNYDIIEERMGEGEDDETV